MRYLFLILAFLISLQGAFAFTLDHALIPGKYVDNEKGYFFISKKDKVKIKVSKKFYLKHQNKNYIKTKIKVEPFQNLKYLNVKKLDSGNYKKYYYALLDFYIRLEKQNTYLFEKDQMFSFYDFFVQQAYASDVPFQGKVCDDHGGELKNKCLFGGWPSVQVGRFCTGPWKHKNNEIIKSINPSTYQNACGSKDLFRCNPDIFGSFDAGADANNTLIDTEKSDVNGLCVKTDGTYNNITKLCQDASAHSPARVSKIIEQNPKPEFSNMRDLATCFCQTKPDYDACRILENQLSKLETPSNMNTPVALEEPHDNTPTEPTETVVVDTDPQPVITETVVNCDKVEKVGENAQPENSCSTGAAGNCSYFVTCKSEHGLELKVPAICKCNEADQNSHLACIAEIKQATTSKVRTQEQSSTSSQK